MPGLFSSTTIKANYSLMPIVAITGFACSMCATYLVYSARKKPDVSFRFKGKERMPEMDVTPEEVRKLLHVKEQRPFDSEVEKLRGEINEHYFK